MEEKERSTEIQNKEGEEAVAIDKADKAENVDNTNDSSVNREKTENSDSDSTSTEVKMESRDITFAEAVKHAAETESKFNSANENKEQKDVTSSETKKAAETGKASSHSCKGENSRKCWAGLACACGAAALFMLGWGCGDAQRAKTIDSGTVVVSTSEADTTEAEDATADIIEESEPIDEEFSITTDGDSMQIEGEDTSTNILITEDGAEIGNNNEFSDEIKSEQAEVSTENKDVTETGTDIEVQEYNQVNEAANTDYTTESAQEQNTSEQEGKGTVQSWKSYNTEAMKYIQDVTNCSDEKAISILEQLNQFGIQSIKTTEAYTDNNANGIKLTDGNDTVYKIALDHNFNITSITDETNGKYYMPNYSAAEEIMHQFSGFGW